MGTLLSIGDFARMTLLSVKALRHYHDVGLLAPVSIDPVSGYRRYDSSQVATAQVIRRLRELGLPLDEVKVVLHAPDVARRNAALIAHLQRMERELQRTQSTVAALRKLIEHASAPLTVEYRSLDGIDVMAIRERIAFDDFPEWWGATFTRLRAALETCGARRAGVDGGLYSSELIEEESGEVIAFIPVEGRFHPSGPIEQRKLPAAEFAIALHQGSLDNLDQTFSALGTFVAERAIGVQGPLREHYVVSALDTPDEAKHRTEICWPIFQTRTAERS